MSLFLFHWSEGKAWGAQQSRKVLQKSQQDRAELGLIKCLCR